MFSYIFLLQLGLRPARALILEFASCAKRLGTQGGGSNNLVTLSQTRLRSNCWNRLFRNNL